MLSKGLQVAGGVITVAAQNLTTDQDGAEPKLPENQQPVVTSEAQNGFNVVSVEGLKGPGTDVTGEGDPVTQQGQSSNTQKNTPNTKWSSRKRCVVFTFTVIGLAASAAFTFMMLEQLVGTTKNFISVGKSFTNVYSIVAVSLVGSLAVACAAIAGACSKRLDEPQLPHKFYQQLCRVLKHEAK